MLLILSCSLASQRGRSKKKNKKIKIKEKYTKTAHESYFMAH